MNSTTWLGTAKWRGSPRTRTHLAQPPSTAPMGGAAAHLPGHEAPVTRRAVPVGLSYRPRSTHRSWPEQTPRSPATSPTPTAQRLRGPLRVPGRSRAWSPCRRGMWKGSRPQLVAQGRIRWPFQRPVFVHEHEYPLAIERGCTGRPWCRSPRMRSGASRPRIVHRGPLRSHVPGVGGRPAETQTRFRGRVPTRPRLKSPRSHGAADRPHTTPHSPATSPAEYPRGGPTRSQPNGHPPRTCVRGRRLLSV